MSEHVRVEKKGPVLSVTLARPKRRNAITVAMYAALADAVEQATADPRSGSSPFAGKGRISLLEMILPISSTRRTVKETKLPCWRFLRALAACETPLVAAVHGNCVGIGTTMLLHCDLVIAEDGTRFSLPFVDLGLVPEAASSLLLPQMAGRRLAARYLLLAEAFGADEAQAIGLVSHRVISSELDAKLKEIVAALLAKPAEALRLTQKLLRTGTRDDILARMKLESTMFAERLDSAEVKEAIASFFAKRSSSS